MLVSHILEEKGNDVVTTTPGTSIVRVAQLFVSAHIGAAVVLEDGGAIVGLVSERDITHHIAAAPAFPACRSASIAAAKSRSSPCARVSVPNQANETRRSAAPFGAVSPSRRCGGRG